VAGLIRLRAADPLLAKTVGEEDVAVDILTIGRTQA
jgi:hypothetical protein